MIAPIKTTAPIDTLKQRGSEYGTFHGVASLSLRLKNVMRSGRNWNQDIVGGLSSTQMEALDMIVHKIARILNGNADHIDSWHDIAGYATLIEEELKGNPL